MVTLLPLSAKSIEPKRHASCGSGVGTAVGSGAAGWKGVGVVSFSPGMTEGGGGGGTGRRRSHNVTATPRRMRTPTRPTRGVATSSLGRVVDPFPGQHDQCQPGEQAGGECRVAGGPWASGRMARRLRCSRRVVLARGGCGRRVAWSHVRLQRRRSRWILSGRWLLSGRWRRRVIGWGVRDVQSLAFEADSDREVLVVCPREREGRSVPFRGHGGLGHFDRVLARLEFLGVAADVLADDNLEIGDGSAGATDDSECQGKYDGHAECDSLHVCSSWSGRWCGGPAVG